MKLTDAVKWNTRVSAVYAVGIWTMIGSYAYFKYTGRYTDMPMKQEAEEEVDDPNKVVYESGPYKVVTVYKEGYVPYTARIYNFFHSFSGGPGRGDGDK